MIPPHWHCSGHKAKTAVWLRNIVQGLATGISQVVLVLTILGVLRKRFFLGLQEKLDSALPLVWP